MERKKNKIVFSAFLLIISLTSCNQKSFDSKEELIAYLKNPENGYYQTKIVNGVEFSLMYRPTDLIVEQELPDIYSEDKVDTLRNKFNEFLFFKLDISYRDNELLNSVSQNQQEFGALVSHLAFNLEKKLYLLNKKRDTIPLLDFIYPRMYGVSRTTSVMLAFDRNYINPLEEKYFLYIEDFGFNTGDIKFKITPEILKYQKLIMNFKSK